MTDLVARLVAAGTPADLVGEVAILVAEAKILEQRRAKDRERQDRRRHVMSRDVTLGHVTDSPASIEHARGAGARAEPTTLTLPVPTQKKQQKQETRASALLSVEFDETFWPRYPHKVGKPTARTAFLKARNLAELPTIMAGLDRYVRDKPPDRPWLNPATFLNQQRFNDQPAPNDGAPTELPKWTGPNGRDREPKNSEILQGWTGVHQDDESDERHRSLFRH